MNHKSSVFCCCLFFLAGCGTPSRSIRSSSLTDLNALPDTEDYEKLKEKNSFRKTIRLGKVTNPNDISEGPRPRLTFEDQEKKVEVTATLWDLPLIKAYLKTQPGEPSSSSQEALRSQLLRDHKEYTQILLAIDSTIDHYFHWNSWTYSLEDSRRHVYLPLKTNETSEMEIVYPQDIYVMGKKVNRPAYKVYHDRGTLYFTKMDLSSLSPWKFILNALEDRRRIEFEFKVKEDRASGGSKKESLIEVPLSDVASSTSPQHETEVQPVDANKIKQIHFDQGSAYFKNEEYDKAIEEWQKAHEMDPSDLSVPENIERAHNMMAEKKREEEKISEQQKKRQMQVHFLLATEHYKAGNYDQAIAEWKEVLKIDPDHQLSQQKIEQSKKRLSER